jgi:hypothetical protein
MRVYMPFSAHLADDIGIVEKKARGLSGPGFHAMPKLMPRRMFARRKKHDGEIFSQRANG